MKSHSLRARLFLASAIAIIATLTITGFGLVYLFERHVERRIASERNTYIRQLASRLNFTGDGTPELGNELADPRFESIYSGLYWQVTDESTGTIIRSRSLWDTQLNLPAKKPPPGKLTVHDLKGPAGRLVRVHERRLKFATPAGQATMRIAVATSLDELKALTRQFAGETAMGLTLLGILLLVASWFQVRIGLSPLRLVEKSLADIRRQKASRIAPGLPVEIEPLADEINKLMDFQEETITKAKNRSADLAHGFKTPLTALKTDIGRLRAKGENGIAGNLEQIEKSMRRQIERELARARIRSASTTVRINPAEIADDVINTLKRTPDGENIRYDNTISPKLLIAMHHDDYADVLGNLAENATRHARSVVRLSAKQKETGICIIIEDDGPGIAKGMRQAMTRRGVSHDQTGAGSGLGLAIVNDVLAAYGRTLQLETSILGGLKASFTVPAAQVHG